MAPKKDWTVMVYLAGDNSLTDESVFSLTEMKKVGSSKHVNIIAQFDPKDDYLPTQRYRITKSNKPGELHRDVTDKSRFFRFKNESKAALKLAQDLNHPGTSIDGSFQNPHLSPPSTETDTGNPITLFNFISLGIEQFEAKHYMVVLAGHGSGTQRDYLLKDDSPTNYLTMNELKQVFDWVKFYHKDEYNRPLIIDILGMDTCLMSMAEVSFQLRDRVQVMVGCESYSPDSGWPYRQILTRLEQEISKHSSVETIATAVVEEYVDFYLDYSMGGLSVHQSALCLSSVSELKGTIKKLAKTLESKLLLPDGRNEIYKDTIILTHWEAQSYNGELYVDLFDFCNRLRKRALKIAVQNEKLAGALKTGQLADEAREVASGFNEVAVACKEVMDCISDRFVLKSCYSGPRFQFSYGVSIYFPWSGVAPEYSQLDFAHSSGWVKFLRVYTGVTRLPPRETENDTRGKANRFLKLNRFRMSSGKGPENPIHSMRNPPIIPSPSECAGDKAGFMEGWQKLFDEEDFL